MKRHCLSSLFGCLSLIVCASGHSFAGLMPGVVPVTQLPKIADLIAVATLDSVTDSQDVETVQLNLIRVLQGQPGSNILSALVPPFQNPAVLGGNRTSGVGTVPRGLIGSTGVWFLKASDNGWSVIQLDNGLASAINTSIPVAATATAPSGTLNQQLLAYLVAWYQSLSAPTQVDQDFRLFGSVAADPEDGLSAISPLMNSPRLDQQAIGLAAAIRVSSAPALTILASEVGNLGANSKTYQIVDALANFFKPEGSSAIAPLQQIAAAHSAISGLDAAVGSALQKISTKDVLPAMAMLLDSPDPQAQLRASWFFAYFTIFADKNGNIPGTGMVGPLDSPTTHNQMPRQGSGETPDQYAQFWKGWWSQNSVDDYRLKAGRIL